MSRKILSWVLVPPMTFVLVGGISPPAQAAPAPNTYSVSVESCDPATGRTPATAYVTNTDDPEDATIGKIEVLAERVADKEPDGYNVAYDILDGETRPIPLVNNGGLRPGTHDVHFILPGVYEPDNTTRVRVPFVEGCSKEPLPDGDPALPPDEPSAKPKGSVRQVGITVVKMKAINRGVTQVTTFKRMIDPTQGRTIIKSFKLNPGESWKRKYRGKAGDRFKLWVQVDVQKAGKIWRNLGMIVIR